MACSEGQIKSGRLVIPQAAYPINQTPGDTGQRPLDPCGDYWENPNVWFERDNPPKNSGDPPSTQYWVAIQGSPTYVAVQVFNNSQVALNNVKIQVWVCDYTMGVGPNSARTSAGGAVNPMTNPDGVSVAPNQSLVVRSDFLWTPDASDAATNGGHLCLAANVYADGPPTSDGTNFLVAPPVFAFCCDSHNAQRNINVAAMSQRRKIVVATGEVFAANPTDREVEVALNFIELRGDAAIRPAIIAQVESEHPGLKPHPSKTPPRDFHLSGQGLGRCKQGKLRLPAKGRVPLAIEVEIDPNEPVGSLHAFHVTQTEPNGDVLGGVTFVTLVTH